MTQRIPRQNKTINERKYDDALFLIDAKLGVLHELNPVGARIWELCDGQHSEQSIAQIITTEFDTTEQQAQKDLDIFLQDMQERELLTLETKQA